MVFPDDIAVAVNLHDGVHLDTRVAIDGVRIGTERDDFLVSQVDICHVEDSEVLELGVVDPQEIMVRVVGLASLGMFPQNLAVPFGVDECVGPLRAGYRTVLEQVGVPESRQEVDDLPGHIDQVHACRVGSPRPDQPNNRIPPCADPSK